MEKTRAEIEKCSANVEEETVENTDEGGDTVYLDLDLNTGNKRKNMDDSVTIKFPRTILDNPGIISMLDRTKTTPNASLGVVAAVLKSGKVVTEEGEEEVNLDNFTFSYQSLKRSADKNRKLTADEIFDNFVENKPEFCVLHWDGKLVDNF